MILRCNVVAQISILVFFPLAIHAQRDCPGGEAPIDTRSTRERFQCNFGACYPVGHTDDSRPKRRCVYSKDFCGNTEVFVTALELREYDTDPCYCEDILDYPATVGICGYGGGRTTPMVTREGECTDGSPLCSGRGGFYLTGDPSQSIGPAYTSCDLPCSFNLGHSLAHEEGEFEGCHYPEREWVTATVKPESSFWGRAAAIQDQYMFIVGDVRAITDKQTAEEDNLVIQGPYTAQDTSASQGVSVATTVEKSQFSGFTDDDIQPRIFDDEVGLLIIDKTTGRPLEIQHFGANYHGENTWAVGANRVQATDELAIALGGKFTGVLEVATQVCTESMNALATTSCSRITNSGNEDTFFTTLSVDVNPNLNLDELPDENHGEMGGYSSFVMGLDITSQTSGSFFKGVRWLVSPHSGTFNGNVRDIEVDSNGDVFVLGRECEGDPVANPSVGEEDACTVLLHKLSATDGAILMTRRFPFLYHAYEMALDEASGMIFFSSSMLNGARSDDDGFECDNSVVPGQVCAATVATDLEGNIIWARILHQTGIYGYFTGGIELAHASDGPYIYATYEETLDSLDRGTPYPVCINDATGVKTPVYEISMDMLITECPEGSTYHNSTSEQALPAKAANTGAICAGPTAMSCAMKLHKFTGLPIFGTSIAAARAVGTSPDGMLIAGSYYSEAFSWAEKMAQTSLLTGGESSVSYQALIDKDTGRGVYVQALANPTGWAQTYASATDPEGNFYVVIGHNSNEMYGNDFDLILPFTPKQGYATKQLLVEKYSTGEGGASFVPSCVESCVDINDANIIKQGYCYISHLCYQNGDTFARSTGEVCPACDADVNQKEATEPAGCLEDGETLVPTSSVQEEGPPSPSMTTSSEDTTDSLPTSSPVSKTNLGTGAKVGIAIGSFAGALLVLFVVLIASGSIGVGIVRRGKNTEITSDSGIAETQNASHSATDPSPSDHDAVDHDVDNQDAAAQLHTVA